MEDVLEVYARPYDENYPVVCLDESPKQLVSEIRLPYIDKYGVKYEDYEYQREGSVDLFMIVEPLGCQRQVLVHDNHKGETWARTVVYIAEQLYPKAKKITLIQDNLSTHKKHNLYNVCEPHRARQIINRLEIVNTPKHGSWLNIAECELSVLSRQALDARFDSKKAVENQVNAWVKKRNKEQKGVDWQFKTHEARIKLKKLYPTVLI
jgi:DDE superfamily endonuclease